jgi:nucleoside-diphosphate-sugar epimerase
MKIFMIGGTGLLGSVAAEKFIQNSHQVVTIALPPVPTGFNIPGLEIILGNYLQMTDETLLSYMNGCEGFVFAAGIDERLESKPPIYEMFKKYNIEPIDRLLKLAKQAGISQAVILGSYFTYFDRERPWLQLSKHHPYIKSRVEQARVALSHASETCHVAVLELPYIFGIQKGRKPVWTIIVERIVKMKKRTYYPKGGTTMVTTKQVAQAIYGALTMHKGAKCYPIGYYNLTNQAFLSIVHEALGTPDKPIVWIPKMVFRVAMFFETKRRKRAGVEGGLNLVKFAALQCTNQFIDPSVGSILLGVEPDDIKQAIVDSIKLSYEALHTNDFIDMKKE